MDERDFIKLGVQPMCGHQPKPITITDDLENDWVVIECLVCEHTTVSMHATIEAAWDQWSRREIMHNPRVK